MRPALCPRRSKPASFSRAQDPNKRAALIDRLLDRDEFADYWAMKWSDLLRVKAEFPIELWPNAAQAYYHWIRASLRDNKPYDRFVREMLTASGSNFRDPPVNFYRAMQNRDPAGIAQAVALTFMGVAPRSGRPRGARRWPRSFRRSATSTPANGKRRSSFSTAASRCLAAMVFPDGTPAGLQPDQDPREAFADWLIAPAIRGSPAPS
jgi:hypothetical protein